MCACKTGYSGDGITCNGMISILFYKGIKIKKKQKIDINECLTNNGGCHTNATCTNTIGSFTCACKSGYSGNGRNCSGTEIFFFFLFFSFCFFFFFFHFLIF